MIYAKSVTNKSSDKIEIMLGNGITRILEAGQTETRIWISDISAKDERLSVIRELNEVNA